MLAEDLALSSGNCKGTLDKLIGSPLFKCLYAMPKPVVHHAHLTASAPIDLLMDFTYLDCVHYSEQKNRFHVDAKGANKDGYIPVNDLRKRWKDT